LESLAENSKDISSRRGIVMSLNRSSSSKHVFLEENHAGKLMPEVIIGWEISDENKMSLSLSFRKEIDESC